MSRTDEESKDQDSESGTLEEHRRRMRFQWHDLMEDLIEDGRRRGLFDDLPGKGKPLVLDQNIYEAGNTLANQIMKANDIKPLWLTQRIAITERVEELRIKMAHTWERYSNALNRAQGDSHRHALAIGWDDQCQRWETMLDRLNKETETYNLKRPAGQMELLKFRLLDELKRIGAPRHLL